MTEELKFPIGRYEPKPYSDAQRDAWIRDIDLLPGDLEYAILNLDAAQLDTPYREGGWTVKELVHHVADSHCNAYTRFKLGLTEDKPTIKPYDQDAWVKLPDTVNLPVNISITLLHALHARWVEVLKHIQSDQWERTVIHPEHGKEMSLWFLLGMYAWHGRHHTAHIRNLRNRNHWG